MLLENLLFIDIVLLDWEIIRVAASCRRIQKEYTEEARLREERKKKEHGSERRVICQAGTTRQQQR